MAKDTSPKKVRKDIPGTGRPTEGIGSTGLARRGRPGRARHECRRLVRLVSLPGRRAHVGIAKYGEMVLIARNGERIHAFEQRQPRRCELERGQASMADRSNRGMAASRRRQRARCRAAVRAALPE